MSKKKKKFRAELAQTFQNLEKEHEQKVDSIVPSATSQKSKALPASKAENITDEDDKFVRRDIKKIALGLGACLLVLLIVWYLNKNTSIIQNLSESLSQVLHIGK